MLVYPTVQLATPTMSPHWKQGFHHVFLDISSQTWLHYRLTKGHPSPRWRSFRGTMAAYSESCFRGDSDFKSYCSSCFCYWSDFYCCFCCKFRSKFMIYLCFSNLISQYHFEVPQWCLMPLAGCPESFFIWFSSIQSRPLLLFLLHILGSSGWVSTPMHSIFQRGMNISDHLLSLLIPPTGKIW